MMKKIYVLLCLTLGLSSLIFAQKSEFGFVLKAGNYGIPVRNEPQLHYADSESSTVTRKLGQTYALGISYTYRINAQLSFGAELLYRRISNWGQSKYKFYAGNGTFTPDIENISIEKVEEQSLTLPVFLKFNPKKALKWSFLAGIGTSRAFSAKNLLTTRFRSTTSPTTTNFLNRTSQADDFVFGLNFNAEIAYQLDKSTSIGLAYTFEPFNQPLIFQFIPINPAIDCICAEPYNGFRANMNSFSVALRHNLPR